MLSGLCIIDVEIKNVSFAMAVVETKFTTALPLTTADSLAPAVVPYSETGVVVWCQLILEQQLDNVNCQDSGQGLGLQDFKLLNQLASSGKRRFQYRNWQDIRNLPMMTLADALAPHQVSNWWVYHNAFTNQVDRRTRMSLSSCCASATALSLRS